MTTRTILILFFYLNSVFAGLVSTVLEPVKGIEDQSLRFTVAEATAALVAASEVVEIVSPTWPRSSDVNDGDKFDIIIVGGGTAGCILANRLTEVEDWDVLVIEAGGDPPLQSDLPGLFQLNADSPVDWAYRTVNDNYSSQSQNGKSVVIHAGKVLGGSSSVGYNSLNRGKRNTYENWGVPGWNYDSALKYFKLFENLYAPPIENSKFKDLHGYDGNVDITTHFNSSFDSLEQQLIDAYKELGYDNILDVADPDALGIGKGEFLASKDGLRSSTARSYLLPIADRKNFKLLKNTLCIEIIIKDKTAVGVKVIRENGDTHSYYANVEVILSAGVYRSPQLLMLSGIGPTEELTKHGIEVIEDLPVGLNYKDHPTLFVLFPGTLEAIGALLTVTAVENLGTFPIPRTDGFISLPGSNAPDINVFALVFPAVSANYMIGCSINFNFAPTYCNRGLDKDLSSNLINPFVLLTNPKSNGSITLNTTDARDYPIIYQGYFNNTDDLDRATEGVKIIARLAETEAYNKSIADIVRIPECDHIVFATEEYWTCYTLNAAGSVFYGFGSCIMGNGGVVDKTLKVYNIDRLRVIDASVIPSLEGAEPLGAVFYLAERGANIIKSQYGFSTSIKEYE